MQGITSKPMFCVSVLPTHKLYLIWETVIALSQCSTKCMKATVMCGYRNLPIKYVNEARFYLPSTPLWTFIQTDCAALNHFSPVRPERGKSIASAFTVLL